MATGGVEGQFPARARADVGQTPLVTDAQVQQSGTMESNSWSATFLCMYVRGMYGVDAAGRWGVRQWLVSCIWRACDGWQSGGQRSGRRDGDGSQAVSLLL